MHHGVQLVCDSFSSWQALICEAVVSSPLYPGDQPVTYYYIIFAFAMTARKSIFIFFQSTIHNAFPISTHVNLGLNYLPCKKIGFWKDWSNDGISKGLWKMELDDKFVLVQNCFEMHAYESLQTVCGKCKLWDFKVTICPSIIKRGHQSCNFGSLYSDYS